MTSRTLILCACAAALASCASPRPPESPLYAERMKDAGDRYTACVTAEAEKDMKNPVRAVEIADAAHARCWTDWEAYRTATSVNFTHGARNAGELQYARDKSEAHLRQFEQEARRAIVDWIVQRSLPGNRP